MTASEIAETLINGNISDARAEIMRAGDVAFGNGRLEVVLMALDVAVAVYEQTSHDTVIDSIARVRHCIDSQ